VIKVYKNFFDSDCLKFIEESIEKSKNTANLRTSYAWNPAIIHQSAPVMIYDMQDVGILREQMKIKLKKDIDVNFDAANFMIYYWPVGSYIPWHDDGHVNFTATLYCNKFWDRDWGGLFLYDENNKILAEVPEWNKLVIQTDKEWHSTTSITRPFFWPEVSTNNTVEIVSTVRTTLQIFI
jgi:hypothetical protein